MEKEQRNALRNAVVKARCLLEKEFQEQLEGEYNILPDGSVLESAPGDPIVRAQLLDVIQHHRSGGVTAAEALERTMRVAAFTVLNRFAALKMAERRGLVRECISHGLLSEGMRELAECAPGLRAALEDGGYRLLLEAVMDEISLDLKVLFDRRDAMAQLWPRPNALDDLLETLNEPELADLWSQDETIGWIYQYFNADDVKQMRKESSAPRNSRELAVRNQFFTPRYVVEFLTDNTLGRIWYEMNQGQTLLKDQCRYLLRRRNEVFFQPDETAPDQPQRDDLNQEQLLQQTVYIPYRPLKDPREIRMLDPACGSMHFGLYAFDLFEVIYDEAWEISHGTDEARKLSAGFASFVSFVVQYPNKATFLADVPRLVIEHNLHGIDIDPRAAQIAGLCLWLRAQRAWQQQGLRPQDRPRIRRSNIVCAEPMPGEEALLDEFIETRLSDTPELKLLGQLVQRVFDAMKLAGEAGSLLKIEEEIATAVAEAKQEWLAAPKPEQGRLFVNDPAPSSVQKKLGLDVGGITNEIFWEKAEERIYAALQSYAEQAQQDGGYQRRLFADDAARGFAFIDLCRKRYYVILMNPPFGYPSDLSKAYVDATFVTSKYDVLAAFVDRGLGILQSTGRLGCITSRTVFFIEFFTQWRESLLRSKNLPAFVDLGSGVLEALVETAACVVEPTSRNDPSVFIRLLSDSRKALALDDAITALRSGIQTDNLFVVNAKEFLAIDGCPLAYWVPSSFRSHFARHRSVLDSFGDVRVGLQTGDNFRFIRATWEVEPYRVGVRKPWKFLAKGGEFRRFYDDIHLVVNWRDDGAEVVNFVDEKGNQRSRPQNVSYYYRPGITYPMRTTSSFSPRVLPAGCIFNVQGNSIFHRVDDEGQLLAALGILSSAAFESFTRMKARIGDMTTAGGAGFAYTPGLIGSMPFPSEVGAHSSTIAQWVSTAIDCERVKDCTTEPSSIFVAPLLASENGDSLRETYSDAVLRYEEREAKACDSEYEIEEIVQRMYGFTVQDKQEVEAQFGPTVSSLPSDVAYDLKQARSLYCEKGWHEDGFSAEASQQRKVASDRYLKPDEICRVLGMSPAAFAKLRRDQGWLRQEQLSDEIFALAQYSLGCAFGRWDVRFATGEMSAPELLDPFAPLPVCPPGQLQNAQGLPLTNKNVETLSTEGRWDYPIDVPWNGILVDNPRHPLDLEARVRQVLQVIWKDRWQAIEGEACEILGVRSLRDYFRKPAGFFADHLKRYSKSRRKAPIYWPLSTASGSYTVWIYYLHLTTDTLFQVVAEHLDPKLRKVQEERLQVEGGQGRADDREAAKLAKQAGELAELEKELEEMKAELLRVAGLPYNPDLNDGVQITAAPLWKLFRLSAWRKVLETTWKKLEKREYDWTHLAHAIWPDRVREKCKADRSLAIAHGLEDICEVEAAPQKKRRSRKRS